MEKNAGELRQFTHVTKTTNRHENRKQTYQKKHLTERLHDYTVTHMRRQATEADAHQGRGRQQRGRRAEDDGRCTEPLERDVRQVSVTLVVRTQPSSSGRDHQPHWILQHLPFFFSFTSSACCGSAAVAFDFFTSTSTACGVTTASVSTPLGVVAARAGPSAAGAALSVVCRSSWTTSCSAAAARRAVSGSSMWISLRVMVECEMM